MVFRVEGRSREWRQREVTWGSVGNAELRTVRLLGHDGKGGDS